MKQSKTIEREGLTKVKTVRRYHTRRVRMEGRRQAKAWLIISIRLLSCPASLIHHGSSQARPPHRTLGSFGCLSLWRWFCEHGYRAVRVGEVGVPPLRRLLAAPCFVTTTAALETPGSRGKTKLCWCTVTAGEEGRGTMKVDASMAVTGFRSSHRIVPPHSLFPPHVPA